MVTSLIVSSPGTEVNFKPTSCLLEFMVSHWQLGRNKSSLTEFFYARLLMLRDHGHYQTD